MSQRLELMTDEDEAMEIKGNIIKSYLSNEKTMENFKKCLERINSQQVYDSWANCGFYTIVRHDTTTDTRAETLEKLAAHFGLADS